MQDSAESCKQLSYNVIRMNSDIHMLWHFVIADRLALMNFGLQRPELTFMKGEERTILFNVKVACTLIDCSSMVAGKQNFDFQLYFDTDLRWDGEPGVTMKRALEVTDGGLGLSSDLRCVGNGK